MLGVNMPSFYDAMWGRTAGQDFGGFFHGSHAEAKLAVYGICSLLEGFGIASDLDNIRPRHLRKLRKVSWADGARPALEIYLSRKPCGRCGSLIRALSTITKIRIKLNFTDTLTKKVHGVSPVDLARGQQRTVLPITIARGVAADGRQDDAVGTTEDNEDDNSWDMMDLDDTDSMIEVEETVCDGLQDDAIATIEPYDADSDMYSSSDDTESDTDIDAGPGDSNQDGATVVISGGDHSNMTPSDDADSGIDIEEEAVGDRLQDEVVVIINNEGDNLAVRSIDDADGTEGAAVESCQDDVEVIIIDGGDDSDTTSADDADSWVDIETLAEEGCENGATAVATGDDNDLDMTFVDDADSGIEMGVAPDDSGQGDAIIISRDGLGTTSSDSTDSGVEIEGAVGESGEDDTVTAAGDDGDDSAMTPSDGAELVVESEVVREPIGQEDTVTITDHDGDDVDNPDVSCSDDASSAMVVEPDSGTDLVDLRTPQPTINRALKFLKTMSAYINKVEAAKLNLRRPEWLIRSIPIRCVDDLYWDES
ncbi:Replicase polyprotein 1a-like protein [Hapsidospora chrysogenum ATCC 11550]|uniref:Replicase polyprotein 1a-like protein n=1 Tax=Hapsidospora chrysogenum (strain ATCC 11550 / CBS 779.69 / DSM 880 / IAM 14645 / JCM 23072 / IMI 49137) TaxID=857340 RepID=A0A086SZI5_HAPC1|nr:Replicase polyprotein 1a-like protein [Hapsidospora chrysogenum ATCC 11550]